MSSLRSSVHEPGRQEAAASAPNASTPQQPQPPAHGLTLPPISSFSTGQYATAPALPSISQRWNDRSASEASGSQRGSPAPQASGGHQQQSAQGHDMGPSGASHSYQQHSREAPYGSDGRPTPRAQVASVGSAPSPPAGYYPALRPPPGSPKYDHGALQWSVPSSMLLADLSQRTGLSARPASRSTNALSSHSAHQGSASPVTVPATLGSSPKTTHQIPYIRQPAPKAWPQPAPTHTPHPIPLSSHPYGVQSSLTPQQHQPYPCRPAPSPQPLSSGQGPAAAPSPKPKVPVDHPPEGSCPGGGVCNGQGGQTCCQGCPALNNRILHSGDSKSRAAVDADQKAKASGAGPSAAGSSAAAGGSEVGVMECFNCQTRELVDWRPRRRAIALNALSFLVSLRTGTTPLWRRDGEGRVACNACGKSCASLQLNEGWAVAVLPRRTHPSRRKQRCRRAVVG